MRTVAALYVEKGGAYFGLEGVDPWPAERDARLYAGPHPVVAHPPCQRWSKLAHIHKASPGRALGNDGGCFAAALNAVRTWGGVLEHPEGSSAWVAFGLMTPQRWGGWVVSDWLDSGGWTCCVEQGHYGHRARKATWLYARVPSPPALTWGPSAASCSVDFMSGRGRERSATPAPFRDLLLSIARGCA